MLEAGREESSLSKRIVLSEHTFSGFTSFLVYLPMHFQLVDLDVERAFYFYKSSNTVPPQGG